MARLGRLTVLVLFTTSLSMFLLSLVFYSESSQTPPNAEFIRKPRTKIEMKRTALSESQTEHLLRQDLDKYMNEGDMCHSSSMALVTLFTTLYDVPSRKQIHRNTLHNWVSLGPGVRALVYLNTTQENSGLISLAKELGWCIEDVPLYKSGLPVVRSMFMDVTTKYTSLFYGYVNSDILFDSSLIHTLKGLANAQYQAMFEENGCLLIGKRTNVDSIIIKDMHTPTEIFKVKKKGKAFLSVAQDYFFTTRQGYPWQRIPDLVVGRPGYDNYLLIQALDWNVNVLDTTDTLSAIHQTGNDGNQASFKVNNRCLNKKLLYPYDYTRGSCLCAKFFTGYDINGDIVVVKRVWWPDKCAKPKQMKAWECTEAPTAKQI